MSGFLDRMAARAGGAAADVAPRVPALFESAAVITAPTGVAALAGGPLPHGLRPPVSPSLPPSLPSRREPIAAAPRASGAEVGQGAPSPAAGVASTESRPQLPAVEARPVAPDREPASIRVERELVPVPGGPLMTPAPQQSRPAGLVVPAVPVVLAAAAPAGAVPESSAATQRGPDVIRVSIGRVDVRAPAAPPRPAPPPVPAAKAHQLSLQDYLRGERGAG